MQPKRADANSGRTPAQLLADREQRVLAAVRLERPDRLPTALFAHFWISRYAGMSNRQAMYDYGKLSAAVVKAVRDLEPDAYVPGHNVMAFGPTLDLIDYRQLEWPGHGGLGENVPYQYLDREYMTVAEYDEYLRDPTGFMLHRYLPRSANAFKPMAMLPHYPSVLHTRIPQSLAAYANPEVRQMLQTMISAGEEMQRMQESAAKTAAELAAAGFPLALHATCGAPFDVASDYLRGSKGAMLDMFRNKDKLLRLLDRLVELLPANAIATADRNQGKYIFFPLHWGLDGFMSPQQFETFFWPPLRRILVGLIDLGYVPIVFWEGDCTSRLEVIADIPPGKAIYMFERSDLKKAKKILGGTVCIRGGMPVSTLITGTPEQTRDTVKRLFDEIGEGGGFILDSGAGVPDEAKHENVITMFETAKECRY